MPALLAEGKAIYASRCAACHGDEGKGDGRAAYLLYPKPRSFTTGAYHFVSTWEMLPTDADLYRIVSRGIPGSSMPSWAHLSARQRWGLVHHIKSLAAKDIEKRRAKRKGKKGVVQVPPPPKNDAASVARGKAHFVKVCGMCHGDLGRGDGKSAASLKDSDGYPLRPRDLTSGVFKGPRAPEHLYRRILLGIPGTPMPALPEAMAGRDTWDLVHFVLSLSGEAQRERSEMRRFRIVAKRVKTLPDHPDASAWNAIASVDLHMMPLWWRYQRPEFLTVTAAHDGKDVALLVVWGDDTLNDRVVRPQDFRDAVALQFSLSKEAPPFFAMGSKEKFVNIWMWKSERQADLKGFHDLDAQYPNVGIDSYPNLQMSPYEQPARKALTLDSDPTFITAWGAGNIVADPMRRSAAEDLKAQGFGTLRARATQQVKANGVWAYGSHRVVFRRALTGKGEHAVSLNAGTSVPIAFAVWNGAAGDRDGTKSVSIWQNLVIEE